MKLFAFVSGALLSLSSFVLAQLPIDPKHIDQLADKDFKWWFTAMFVIGLISASYIFKLQLKQNTEQRQQHADLLMKYITFMQTDHTKFISISEHLADTIHRNNQLMEQIIKRYEANDKRTNC